MKFEKFKQKIKSYPFLRSNNLHHITPNVCMLRRQISEWVKKGSLVQLKRGVYTLPVDQQVVKFSRFYLANQLYSPSYVSLETALSYYDVIPEKVNVILSISPKKTQQFTNVFGQFIYRHLKPNLYDDFIQQTDEFNNQFFIASKEKAIVDFLFFKSRELKYFDETIFQDSFRFQNIKDLNSEYILKIANKYQYKKLMRLIKLLIKIKGTLL